MGVRVQSSACLADTFWVVDYKLNKMTSFTFEGKSTPTAQPNAPPIFHGHVTPS